MEEIIDVAAFSEKITGAFVRIRISGAGQKQDMYRLVKVVGKICTITELLLISVTQ
jgi:hypothetical protein